ncbi:MAG: hypothetical protein PHX83_14640 [Acidobacteriia bacterium]|nr:hypothetical protein [Terriglobia bacterium]
MTFQLERALVSRKGGVPAFALNPVSGSTWQALAPAARILDGDPVHVLDRDYRTTTTTLLRSHDGGRTWVVYQVHEILQTTTKR